MGFATARRDFVPSAPRSCVKSTFRRCASRAMRFRWPSCIRLSLCATVKEVPVHFVDRKRGQSKIGLADIVEFVINAWWIRMRAMRTFVRFALVGASGTLVNLGVFSAALHANLNKYVASPVAVEVSIIWNFLLNNYWTFRERKTSERTRIKGLKYNLVSVVSLGVSFATFLALSIFAPRLS